MRQRTAALLALVLCVLGVSTASAQTGQKHALLVGISRYPAVPLLSGFVSKGLTIAAAMESGHFWPWIVLIPRKPGARELEHLSHKHRAELMDLTAALWRLNPQYREALILVGAGGFSYEEAAELCGCAVGTMKARVSRARRQLAEAME